jgi:hypothetical protein
MKLLLLVLPPHLLNKFQKRVDALRASTLFC